MTADMTFGNYVSQIFLFVNYEYYIYTININGMLVFL